VNPQDEDKLRWQRIKQLFDEAVELDQDERRAWLAEQCGDDRELLAKVQSLLECDEESSSFLQPPLKLGDEAQHLDDGSARLGRRVGAYTLDRVIGSGGMGTVYEATQEQPRRTVAVKLMRPGIASRSALRRFEYESQLLARLRHPGIAQVYDAGTHRDGEVTVPFFAMEYIVGAKPVTDYAKEKKLGTRERMALFANVCEAVHHGHQKGIIHRDLKPGNILVDAQGQVKIIDFGVARATDSDMAVTTLHTDIGQLIGTLQYMSPEQCAADPQDIDTRSDVYALGVVFYELLCERLPYEIKGTAIHEATRVIREQEPAKLSTFNKALRGDVETIALKALEKDRERRYQSASAFTVDINRYLNNEAISARPPSVIYQLQVFARRNRLFIGAVGAVFIALMMGLVGISAMYLRAENAREDTALARDAEHDQRVLADERFEEVIRLADLKRLANARGAADSLWPAHPEQIEGMETWLAKLAAPLQDNLPKHEATLIALRQQASDYDAAQQQHDRETHPKAGELGEMRQRLAQLREQLDNARVEQSQDPEAQAEQVDQLVATLADAERSLAELEASVNVRRTWRLADDETQWRHDTLVGLVEDLRSFVDPDPAVGTLASVRSRLKFAESIKERSVIGSEASSR